MGSTPSLQSCRWAMGRDLSGRFTTFRHTRAQHHPPPSKTPFGFPHFFSSKAHARQDLAQDHLAIAFLSEGCLWCQTYRRGARGCPLRD